MLYRLVSLMLVLVVLAACGSTPTAEAPTIAPAESTGAAAEPTVAPTTEAAEATVAPTTESSTEATAETTTEAPADAPVEASAEATPESTTAATGEDYPVSIEHKYGSTEITERPQRVVTVGYSDQDAVLALGVTPVGVTEWYGNQPYATWPWAQDLIGDPKPTVLNTTSGIAYETISSLQPDVIIALYSGITQEEYDLLTQIAPTVAQPGDVIDYGITWQTQARTVGTILGESARAEDLIEGVEDKFASVRAEHPEFAGKTALVATPYQGIWVYGEQDPRGQFLKELGFNLPEGLSDVTGSEFGANLSEERADLLDVDAIIWLDPDDAQGPLGGPIYASLPVHTEGREIFVSSYEDPLGAATSFVTVVSLPFLLDGIVPRIAQAVDGDPASVVATSVPAAATAAPATTAETEATAGTGTTATTEATTTP